MEIYVRGVDVRIKELKEKLGDKHVYTTFNNSGGMSFDNADIVFDLNLDDHPEEINDYKSIKGILVVSCLKYDLNKMTEGFKNNEKVVGLNALPGFINREVWEMSALEDSAKKVFESHFPELKVQWVRDRVGMISPRVLAMIINEACFTLEEGTANVEDIDKGMKLGTNYPYGPFEWADKIGVDQIYEILNALSKDTGDERFKICSTLKEKARLKAPFYN